MALAQPPKTFVPLLDHALKAYALQADRAARGARGAVAAARLFPFALDAEAWNELWDMHKAAADRLGRLQLDWMQGWLGWARYSDQIAGARTLSKFAERESNIVNQAGQLVSQQVSDWVAFVEAVEVDYLYWLTAKAAEKDAGGAS